MSTEAHLENGELGWGSFIWRPATLSINLQKRSSRGGQLLRNTFGGHFKALGDMHNCSDFLKNIYSVINDVQNATELVVVPSMMRSRFSLRSPFYHTPSQKAGILTQTRNKCKVSR